MRHLRAYIPEYPVGTAEELCQKIREFFPIARAVIGVRNLKIITFGHHGKTLFEVFKYLGVQDIGYNQPKSLLYPTENPFA